MIEKDKAQAGIYIAAAGEGKKSREKYYTKITEMYKKCFVQIGKYLICKFVRYVEFDFFNRKIIAKAAQKCYADSN